ncbi:MAG: CPBP family intramembrane metalloprotease [Ruminiclostridium sp.]|nr:CPBP family intramembrane metalloprotease [Ruminiclostridium sp.]
MNSAAPDSREYEVKKLALRYGIAAAILILNSQWLTAVFVAVTYSVVALLPNAAELSNTGTDSGFVLIMFLNEIASYLFPLIGFMVVFRGDLARNGKTPPGEGYRRFIGETPVLYLAGIGVAMTCGTFTSIISRLLNYLLGIPQTKTAFSDTLPTSPVMFAAFMFCICVIAPVSEELLYRHILLRPLRQYGDIMPAFISALLFALSHYNFDQFLYTFGFGFFLAIIAIRSDSVIPTIIVHSLNNIVVCFNTYMPETFGSDSLDSFFHTLGGICSRIENTLFFAGLFAALLTIPLHLLRLKEGDIPAKRQFVLFLKSPLFVASVGIMLVITFLKLYK